MKLSLIIYAFLLGLINRNILCKIPVLYLNNNTNNITIVLITELITFIILEVLLYRKSTTKEAFILSTIKILSYFLGYIIDYFIIYPQFNEIFDNVLNIIIHSITSRAIIFLLFTSALIALMISANREDKCNIKEKNKNI